jgi:hypothetical protein
MTTKTKFRNSMIADAQKASNAMQGSKIGKQLKANGFTSATMKKEADDLTALHATAEAAHSTWLEASGDLSARAQSFEQLWSRYCNIVRGTTQDVQVRKAHGVSSPGVRKGPTFKRAPKKKASTPTTPPAAPPAAT